VDPVDPKQPTEGASQRTGTDVIRRVRVLSGKYRLGRLLGEGGMGAVYEADHAGLNAKVAIKLLSEGGSLDHKALTRFRREAIAMGAVRHENVVAVLDTGADEDGVPYLVMELLEGESLAQMLRRERVLSASLSIWIAAQVLAGLSAAHAKGVIHRDLKPGNVFIARQPDGTHKVKILDFGISKLSESSESMNVTADGALVGTPNFMAPEQITGQGPIDGRVDVYAVGVLLYRMVTGRLPYVSKQSDDLYRKILAGQAVPPRRRQADVPEPLEAAILKAMALDRDQRFADAAGFREALLAVGKTLPDELPTLPATMPASNAANPAATADSMTQAATVAALPSSLHRRAGSVSRSAARSASVPATSHIGARPIRKGAWLAGALGLIAIGGATVVGIKFAKEHQAAGEAPTYDGPPVRYGVQRYSSREEVVAAHRPIADYLASRLERPVELVILEDDLALRDALAAGKVDLAALSPYAYVRAKASTPALALLAKPVTAGGPSYRGDVLVRVDDPARALADVAGKKFCFVSPGSTSGWLYPRALLRGVGIDPDRGVVPVYGQDHLGTLRLLDRGACDAAAVYAEILATAGANGMPPEHFRVLASTDPIPYDAYVARPELPAAEQQALQAGLLALEPGSEPARRVLGADAIGEIAGFVRAADADYEGVRRIEHLLDDGTAPPR
jgi:phosphate/phosphite/phosphonate ABC transporter binding protein